MGQLPLYFIIIFVEGSEVWTYTVELVDVAEGVLHLLDINGDQVYIITKKKTVSPRTTMRSKIKLRE